MEVLVYAFIIQVLISGLLDYPNENITVAKMKKYKIAIQKVKYGISYQ